MRHIFSTCLPANYHPGHQRFFVLKNKGIMFANFDNYIMNLSKIKFHKHFHEYILDNYYIN